MEQSTARVEDSADRRTELALTVPYLPLKGLRRLGSYRSGVHGEWHRRKGVDGGRSARMADHCDCERAHVF